MIDEAELDHLMELAKLKLSAAEQEQIRGDLNAILGYFSALEQLDTEGVPELARPVELENVLREDQPGPMFSQEEALGLAAAREQGFFKVPRVVE